jgi:hypothetical protein
MAVGLADSTDRGLSQDAQAVYESIRWATDYSHTVSIGRPAAELHSAIEEAVEHGHTTDTGERIEAEPSAIRYALDFARTVPVAEPVPDVYVDADGDVCFEWSTGPRKVFALAIGADGTLNFAGLYGYSRVHGVQTLGQNLSPIVVDGIQRALWPQPIS